MAARTSNAFLVFLGSVAALVLVGGILIWRIAAGPKPQDLDAKRAAARIAVREKLDQEASALLTTEGWVDKAKEIARVPVASVFAATATELTAKKPAPSQIKVEPPLPMPVIDPNSPEPPPPALPSAPQGADTIRFAPPEPQPSASIQPASAIVAANQWIETSPLTK
jgi:hypothetical protein